MRGATLFIFAACFTALVIADCYMHCPKGGNNRLNSKNTNTRNDNRMFDSQNNNNGGYNKPKLSPGCSFYSKSLLQVEWTVQHGCGQKESDGGKLNCNMVMQYACGKTPVDQLTNLVDVHIRDGERDEDNPALGNNNLQERKTANANAEAPGKPGVYLYGQHESQFYYDSCKKRERNKGLFTADRNVNNNRGATATRQNNNGNQRGFECPEERDYYPYWHPTPWIDVAVLIDPAGSITESKICNYFKSESFNTRGKHYCSDPAGEPSQYNNEADCEQAGQNWLEHPPHNKRKNPSIDVGSPDCQIAQWARVNHLGNVGNGLTGKPGTYDWILPKVDKESAEFYSACTFRLRYNISTQDYDGWKGFSHGSKDEAITAASNGENSPVKNNPTLMTSGHNLTLAINTAQFGRTFQDRSHVFKILPRDKNLEDFNRVYNCIAKGKRGNIVQAYPATEYDFGCNNINVFKGDYLHFCFEGSHDNNQNYAGEGRQSTDAFNMVELNEATHSMFLPLKASDRFQVGSKKIETSQMFNDEDLAFQMAWAGQPEAYCAPDFNVNNNDPNPPCCLTYAQLQAKHGNNQGNKNQDKLNCGKLNSSPQYWQPGPIRTSKIASGTHHYMSSRNNNFSNRSQKGTITVSPHLSWAAVAFVIIGVSLFVGGAVVAFGLYYSQSHPGSACANIFQNLN
mmetsp:Transcript_9086/g.10091  ORF Transcript_9086/g.10091 Transcript_9086/m.10091 type:complete len:682 (+) Transcript_9086:52-2097(+)